LRALIRPHLSGRWALQISSKRIHVDTDTDGVVWLSGSARTQEAIDKAESIARETEGVKDVHSHIKIKKDD